MRQKSQPNRFQKMTDEELAHACNHFIELIEKRTRQTKTGDEIRHLLIACGNRLWWMRPGYQTSGIAKPKSE